MNGRQKENYTIELKGGTKVEKKENFDNQIACRTLGILSPNISKSVFILNTQNVITEEKRKQLQSQGIQDIKLVSHDIVGKILLNKSPEDLEEMALFHNGNALILKKLKKFWH